MSEEKPALAPADNFTWKGERPGDAYACRVRMGEEGRIYVKGNTSDRSAYAVVRIEDKNGKVIADTLVDFYSLAPAEGLRYISPSLGSGEYLVRIEVSDMKSNWSDKKRSIYGSKGYDVEVTEVGFMR